MSYVLQFVLQAAISAYDSPSKPDLVKIKPAMDKALYCTFGFQNKTVKCVNFLALIT
jgi:hypothetical protein